MVRKTAMCLVMSLASLCLSAADVKPAEKSKPAATKVKNKRPAKITSDSTYYDRKEGVAVFSGNVDMDDEQYQLHADKVFVYTEGTNELKRVIAVGNVAMTNEMRRAYGAKASYYRKEGLVILYSGDGTAAEVRDESKAEPQIVRGEKIRFWIDSEQVEVLKAEITAPASGGMGSLKQIIKK